MLLTIVAGVLWLPFNVLSIYSNSKKLSLDELLSYQVRLLYNI